MASPSGTATTMSVTAIIKKLRRIVRLSSENSNDITPRMQSLITNAANVSAAMVKPIFPITVLSLSSCLFNGVFAPVISAACLAVFPISVESPTVVTSNTPSPSVTVVPLYT